jgi:hypothetical protein
MRIGDHLTYDGRLCVLVGLDPMGVADRNAQLEDVGTGERFQVPVEALEEGGGLQEER